jgi:O-antigen ligase
MLGFLCTGFFGTLFLPGMPVVNNIFTGLLCVYAFFYNSLAEKKTILRRRKSILLMILFYFLHVLSAVLSTDKQEALRLLVMRIPLLLFPLSLGLLYIRPVLKARILLSYYLVVLLAALVCLAYALVLYVKTGDGVYLYNDSLSLPTGVQSSYFSLMVTMAIFSCLYLLESGTLLRGYGVFAVISLVFLLVFHFLLASRISMTILYTGLLILAGSYIVKRKRPAMGLVAFGILLCVGLCLHFFPKTLNRFRELEYPSYDYKSNASESHYNGTLTPDQWNGGNIRLAIWNCGWQEARAHWLTGVQLGDKQKKLMEVYRANHFDFAFRNKRNMHNLYLDILCCFGVVGLIVFLAGYVVVPLRSAWRSADWLGLALLLTFIFSMTVESYFDRSLGCLLAGFFFSFIAACCEDERAAPGRWDMWVVR